MAIQSKIVQISAPTVTGNVAYTGVGFEPQLIKFFSTFRGANTAINDIELCLGAADAHGNQFSAAVAERDNQATSDSSRRGDNANCIIILDADNSSSTKARASHISMDSDGFTLNWSDVGDTRRVYCLCIAGVTDVIVGEGTIPSSTGTQAYTVETGHEPDALEIISVIHTTNAVRQNDLRISVGFSDGTNQIAFSNNSDDAEGTTQTSRSGRTDAIISIIDKNTETFVDQAALDSFDANGFTLDWDSNLHAGQYFSYISYKGVKAKVGTFQEPGSTGAQAVTGVGFEPMVLQVTAVYRASVNVAKTNLGFLHSFATDSEQMCIYGWSSDGQATSQAYNGTHNTIFMRNEDDGTPTVYLSADLDSLDSDGFTIGWNTLIQENAYYGYFALGDAAVALVSTDITTGAPVVGTGTLTQNHDLTSVDVITGATDVDSTTLTQNHALNSIDIETGNPVVENTSITQDHKLTSVDIETAPPELGAPDLTQIHNISADDIVSGSPDLDTPALTQNHDLSSENILSGQPELTVPDFIQNHQFATGDITTGQPVLGEPILSEFHGLESENIITAPPVLDSPVITQLQILSSEDIVTGQPVVDPSTLTQNHDLISTDIITGAPIVGVSELHEIHNLESINIITGAPVIDPSTITQIQALLSENIITGIPVCDSPVITQEHALLSSDIITEPPVIGIPDLHLVHILGAEDITTGQPILTIPVLTDYLFTGTSIIRIYEVIKEDRTFMVGNEIRTFPITNENRSFNVSQEIRIYEVPKDMSEVIQTEKLRIYIVPKENRIYIHPLTNK